MQKQELKADEKDMFLLLFFRDVKIYQGLMIPHALYTHENPNIFIAVYS